MGVRGSEIPLDLPTTDFEFEERFSTEEECVEYLRERRWPDGFICPRCEGRRSWRLQCRLLEECAGCGHQVSIIAGTVFESTRKPLRLWFRVIRDFLVSKRGCSAKEIQRRYGLSYQTAWTWLHKIRVCMDRHEVRPLQGTVEVDEAYIGGTDDVRHKGRSLAGNKCLVVAAVEDKGSQMGRLRLDHLGNATARSLSAFVNSNIKVGSTVRTDGLAAYKRLGNEGYKHFPEVIRNSKNASKKLPKVHRVFSLLRRVLLGTYQGAVSPQHLGRYLDEYVFRFNRRSSGSRYLLVERLLGEVFNPPPTYAELVGRGEEASVVT